MTQLEIFALVMDRRTALSTEWGHSPPEKPELPDEWCRKLTAATGSIAIYLDRSAVHRFQTDQDLITMGLFNVSGIAFAWLESLSLGPPPFTAPSIESTNPFDLVRLVIDERHRQNTKWGGHHNRADQPLDTWNRILTEEVGEVAKELETTEEGTPAEINVPALATELLQVIAVTVNWLEMLPQAVSRYAATREPDHTWPCHSCALETATTDLGPTGFCSSCTTS